MPGATGPYRALRGGSPLTALSRGGRRGIAAGLLLEGATAGANWGVLTLHHTVRPGPLGTLVAWATTVGWMREAFEIPGSPTIQNVRTARIVPLGYGSTQARQICTYTHCSRDSPPWQSPDGGNSRRARATSLDHKVPVSEPLPSLEYTLPAPFLDHFWLGNSDAGGSTISPEATAGRRLAGRCDGSSPGSDRVPVIPRARALRSTGRTERPVSYLSNYRDKEQFRPPAPPVAATMMSRCLCAGRARCGKKTRRG